ncbi:MAG: gamma-glutamyl-gamma-aminobutyrate hydrolase family protein [Bacteroidota bacterium]
MKKFHLTFIIINLSFIIQINAQNFSDTLFIALSKASGSASYQNYINWLKSVDSTIVIVDMINKKPIEAATSLEKCSALLLTGGLDVYPGRYGKENDTSRCEIDLHRDSVEFALIKKALKMKLPILGVCRGEQILNVVMGGSLIVDIPQDYDTIVKHRCGDDAPCFHEIQIIPGTLLYELGQVLYDTVNTYHHQAVDKLSRSFKITARTNDGIIEAYEWKHSKNKPFLLAVQFHPEKLDKLNPLAIPVAEKFLGEAKKYQLTHQKK